MPVFIEYNLQISINIMKFEYPVFQIIKSYCDEL